MAFVRGQITALRSALRLAERLSTNKDSQFMQEYRLHVDNNIRRLEQNLDRI